jgi:tetratricopeptide (TPR) repeat protein
LLAPHNCAQPDQPSKKKKSASKTGDAGGVGTIFKEGDPLYFKMQGNDAFMKGDFAAAVTSYGQAIDDDPTNHVLYSNRAAANIEIGDADALAAAVQDADKCIELEAEWAKGYFRKGCALRAMGLPDQAEVALTTGLRLQPSNQDIETALLDLAECQRLSDIQEGKQDKFTALVNWLLDAGAKFPKLFMEGCVLRAPALLCSGRKRAQHCSLAAALQQHCSSSIAAAALQQQCSLVCWPGPGRSRATTHEPESERADGRAHRPAGTIAVNV